MRAFTALVLALCFLLTPSLQATSVVVAVYNVQNYLTTDRRVDGRYEKSAPKPESEIQAVIEVISEIKPDILGVIEMGDEALLSDFQTRLKAAGLDYPHREWVKGADQNRHVALLSRFPIVARNSRDDVPFELNGVQTRIGRGILDVTVDLPGGHPLRLVGVHLKSRRQVPEFDEAAMRAKESLLVRAHLDAILEADPAAKLMLFGDLNDTKNELPVRQLIGKPKTPLHMRDLFLTDANGLRWTHFWSTADIYSRIDFLLVSPALWPWITMEKSGVSDSTTWFRASDHRALYATITPPSK